MFFVAIILLFGFASAQRVIQLTYCSLDEHNLRMDCKYAVPPESPVPFCKYTNGERLFDTTDPDEEQHAPFKKRARVRIFPGNICRLLFKGLPNGKSNFTCNIKLADSGTASKTSVVEKKLLLPCSGWSVLLQSCSGLMLTLMTLPMLLEFHGL
ncbi:thy-1 membrane glycoprotein [Spinachia spinachia]